MQTRLPSVLLVALLATLAAAQPAPPPAAKYAAAIDASRGELHALLKAQEIPGMSVAVVIDGKVVWSEGLGLADIEQDARAKPSTRYRLGSISKLFTAAIAARLAERGTLDLDAPIQKYVPAFPVKQAPITSRQLLGHLAGIRHYRPTDPIFAGKRYDSLADGLAIFRDDPLLNEPGAAYVYTSYGYNLLGVVIEAASGKSFAANLQTEVAAPLGLATLAVDDNAAIVPGRSAFYDKTADKKIRNAAENDSSYKWPSGGTVASAEDVARFASAHLKPGYIGAPMLRTMFTPQTMTGGKVTNVGLGWRINEADGVRYYHHGGSITGGRAVVLALPNQRVSVAILANFLGSYDEKQALAIARRFAEAAR